MRREMVDALDHRRDEIGRERSPPDRCGTRTAWRKDGRGACLGLGTRVDRSRLLTLSRATPVSVVHVPPQPRVGYVRTGIVPAMAT